MTERSLANWMRCLIVAMAACGISICILWVPMGVEGVWLGGSADVRSTELWVQSAFFWMTAIPCFWILTVAWNMTIDMKTGKLFTVENSLRVKRVALVLTVALIVFLVGNLVFAILGWHRYMLVYCLVGLMGFVLVACFAALSHYLYRAAELQEESEGTI